MTARALALRPARLAAAGVLALTGCATRPQSPSPSQTPSQPMPAELMPPELRPPPAAAPPRPLSLDSSLEAICATPGGKAVLDRDLPGLTARPEFAMFKAMTLKQLQPMSRGHLTDADLAKVGADLAALNATTGGK